MGVVFYVVVWGKGCLFIVIHLLVTEARCHLNPQNFLLYPSLPNVLEIKDCINAIFTFMNFIDCNLLEEVDHFS